MGVSHGALFLRGRGGKGGRGRRRDLEYGGVQICHSRIMVILQRVARQRLALLDEPKEGLPGGERVIVRSARCIIKRGGLLLAHTIPLRICATQGPAKNPDVVHVEVAGGQLVRGWIWDQAVPNTCVPEHFAEHTATIPSVRAPLIVLGP